MSHLNFMISRGTRWLNLCMLAGLAACGSATQQQSAPPSIRPIESAPSVARIASEANRFQLYVNGQPFYIKGAGLASGSMELLAASGANAVRTWSTDFGVTSTKQVLDKALANGLHVALGLEVARERHGFDYNNAEAVQRQLEIIKAEVLKYKDHPAVIIWVIGNELNLNSSNPRVWNAVNDISKMIHAVDRNHLTMTTLAGFSSELTGLLNTRAPDLDVIGIQMYADVVNLPRYLQTSGLQRPYLLTEWGTTGHWEVATTDWGVPIEDNSSVKADLYRKRYDAAIASDRRQCLGSFAFLWGQKQERTPTWYGMFLETGEKTAAVDTMQAIWSGLPPDHVSPRLEGAWLDGKTAYQSIRLQPGQTVQARIQASSSETKVLQYRWLVSEESRDLKTGGDEESKPPALPGLIANDALSEISLTAPKKPGPYRLFSYVYDGKGAAAHVNLPFFVEDKPRP